MRVITSGRRYLDIDGYAGCVAYAELLRAQGTEAKAVSTAPLNESISPKVRAWSVQFAATYPSSALDTFTVIDVSDPAQLDGFVDIERVDEVIDHHLGFEDYWQKRTGVKTQIEFVGAACTQIYERWLAAELLGKISQSSARLLICGILDNTLNFGAEITSSRDQAAYDDLLTRADLPSDWPAQYFTDCQTSILAGIDEAIRNDSKVLTFQTFDQPISIGQLVVWDGRAILDRHYAVMKAELRKLKPNWFMNLISLDDRCSYFISDDPEVQKWLSNLLGCHFIDSVATAKRPWLRKEIIKRDIERNED